MDSFPEASRCNLGRTACGANASPGSARRATRTAARQARDRIPTMVERTELTGRAENELSEVRLADAQRCLRILSRLRGSSILHVTEIFEIDGIFRSSIQARQGAFSCAADQWRHSMQGTSSTSLPHLLSLFNMCVLDSAGCCCWWWWCMCTLRQREPHTLKKPLQTKQTKRVSSGLALSPSLPATLHCAIF